MSNAIKLSRCTPLIHQAYTRWGQNDKLINMICMQMAGWLVGTESSQDRLGGNYPVRYVVDAPPTGGQEKLLSTIMLERASELWNVGRPINVFWSGGIDSTAMLVALMMTNNNWNNQLHITTTQRSITEEYPKFFEDYLSGSNVTVVDGDRMLHRDFYSDDEVNLTGDLADQLFGSGFSQRYVGQFDKAQLHTPLAQIRSQLFERATTIGTSRLNTVTRWPRHRVTNVLPHINSLSLSIQLTHLVSEDQFLTWVDNHLSRAPFKLNTLYDMMWWLNFTLKWTEKKYRLVGILGDSSIEPSASVFFDTPDFQWWSMTHHHEKIQPSDWKTYKQPLKDFIFSFTNDDQYRTNKTKEVSLMHTLEPINGIGQNMVTYWDTNGLLLTRPNTVVPASAMRSVCNL